MKVLVLAGGSDQIALIEEYHKHSCEVVLIDFYDNPPAKRYADKHIVASTLDVDAVMRIAREEKVNLITTACTDQALLSVAQASEELHLPCYISYKAALNVTNKKYMKEQLLKNCIPTAKYLIVTDAETISPASLTFPVVVKPVDCNSSKGVKKVLSKDALAKYVFEAASLSRTGTAIIEEFKEGVEISADFYIVNGKVSLLSVSGSYKMRNVVSFTITQSIYPVVSIEKEKDILAIGEQIAHAFELYNSPLLVQLIMDASGNLFVLEFSARMGGGSKYYLIQTLSGVNVMQAYVNMILGRAYSIDPHKQVNYALMNYAYCKPGVLTHISHINELRTDGIIDKWFQYKTYGAKFEKAETSSDRALGFLITATTQNELCQKLNEADNGIRIENERGEDIMLHGIYQTIQ